VFAEASGEVVSFLFVGVKHKAWSYSSCSAPKSVPKLPVLAAEALLGHFTLSPAIHSNEERRYRGGAG